MTTVEGTYEDKELHMKDSEGGNEKKRALKGYARAHLNRKQNKEEKKWTKDDSGLGLEGKVTATTGEKRNKPTN